jgi:hypothetical protein
MDLLTTYTDHSELQALNNAFADFHTLQNTTVPVKPFPACYLHQPFPGSGF